MNINNIKFEIMKTFETDALSIHLLMDDANVPNLISVIYLNYMDKDDLIY